ncbi:MAG: hypothetical protein EBE86_026830 [Hormoscilla sp. GUM202]|nr:hypothetical protein [Hormoscilla sp. GM7CHS1pb]MBO1350764.1 hypothetical protein [Hormoscilla sp. GUM202]
MANLPEDTINTVFSLQRRLLQLGHEASATAFVILEQFGETEETIPELEELDNVRERAIGYSSRLYRLLWQSAVSQPVATAATMNLLARSIAEAEAGVDAGYASIQDVKRNWNLS